MNLPGSNNSGVYTDFQGLSALRAKASSNAEEALPVVAKQFEALFVQTLMKGLRATTSGDPMLGDGGKMYQELFDQQISLELSQAGGIGLAAVIERQLRGLNMPVGGATIASSPSLSSHTAGVSRSSIRSVEVQPKPLHAPPATNEPIAVPRDFSSSPSTFVREMMPYATRAGRLLGVDPKVLVAQAALETGWGKSVITDGAGQSSFNLFGIKADSRWHGAKVEVPTLEYEQGVLIKVKAPFRKYGSIEESFSDYARFITTQPRYEGLLKTASSPQDYAYGLQAAGYATDPRYAQKILQVFRRIDASAGNDGI